jgi:hypothetical protein
MAGRFEADRIPARAPGTLAAAPLLAQIPGGQANLPPLPEPPFHERWLFEQPFLPAAALVLAGVVASWILRRTGRRRAWVPALAGVALGATVAVTGLLVTTPRERVAAAARALVVAVRDNDQPALAAALHEQVQLRMRAVGAGPVGRQAILDGADRLARSFPVRAADVLDVRAAVYDGGAARTQVRVRLDAEQIPPYSWWQIDWQLDDAGVWRATAVQPLWILGIDNPAG